MNYYALGLLITGVGIGTGTLWGIRKNYKKHMLLVSIMLTLLIGIILYYRYLLGLSPFLYTCSDGFNQFLPIYKDFIRTLKEGNGFPLWNFSIGFGATQSYLRFIYPTNFLPILAGAIWDEGVLEICAAWMQVVRMLLSAVFMFMFLKKIRFSDLVCLNMSIAYSLCGILMIKAYWWSIGDECYIAMFILWSVECYFKDKKWYFIPLSIAVLASCFGVYYMYLYAIELFIYSSARYIYDKKTLKGYCNYIFKCAMLYLLGALMASFILFDSIRSMLGTARYTDTKEYVEMFAIFEKIDSKTLLSAILSMFDVNSSGIYHNYSGALNLLERPILYCGMGCLFLIPQAIIMGEKHNKKLILFGLTAAGIYIFVPTVTDIFNLFIKNEELGTRSYRLSILWIIIMMIIIAGYGLDCGFKKNRFNSFGILLTGMILVSIFFFCLLVAPQYGITIDYNVTRWVLFFILIWMIFFLWFGGEKKETIFRINGAVILVCLIVFEMGHSAKNTISGSLVYAQQEYTIMKEDSFGFYGDVSECVEFIKNYDQGFYRIGGIRPVIGNYCSPLYFGIYDSSYYMNINDKTYEFLNELYPESFENNLGTKYSIGVGDNLYLSTLTGYKYMLIEKNQELENYYGYKYLTTVGNISIYENTLSLALGINYDMYMEKSVFNSYTDEEQQRLLLHCVILEDGSASNIDNISEDETDQVLMDETNEIYEKDVIERKCGDFSIDSWKEDHIIGTVSTNKDTIMTFSIPNVSGWHVYVDGKEKDIIDANLGFIAIELSKGDHLIELEYQPITFKLGLCLSVVFIIIYLCLIHMCLNHHNKIITAKNMHKK